MKKFDEVVGLIHKWMNRIGLIALTIIALMMIVKALGIPWPFRTPPLDQSTGVAIAALAYVLHR